jgi:dTDP-4-dehydrorhamnose 3,5-epimerase
MIFEEIIIRNIDSFEDFRGDLFTLYKFGDYNLNFNHDKVSISRKNVLRGLHGDNKSWKLITCLSGEIYLVIVDMRKESKNYLKWDSIIISEQNRTQVLVPPRFANGHLVLSDKATLFYKWSYDGDYPDVNEQFNINYLDPKIDIDWPIRDPILSKRDKKSIFIQ